MLQSTHHTPPTRRPQNGRATQASRGPQKGPRRPSSNRRGPQQTRQTVTHGEQFLKALPTGHQIPADTLNNFALRLNAVKLPPKTALAVARADRNRLTILWENTFTQHCIALDINLTQMLADYEYSMVCEEEDALKAFPEKPLGSALSERINLDLRRDHTWTWIGARIAATRHHLPD